MDTESKDFGTTPNLSPAELIAAQRTGKEIAGF